jgi:hypothetical protein
MKDWLPIIISGISLVVSIAGIVFNFLKDARENAALSVRIPTSTKWAFGLYDRNKVTVHTNKKGLIEFEIEVINTSDKDIGYYDFRVLNKNQNLFYYSEAQFNTINHLQGLNVDTILIDYDRAITPIVLPSSYGLFKAHQETVLAVVINAEDVLNSDYIYVEFKVARKKYFFGDIVETHSENIKISHDGKPNYQQLIKEYEVSEKNGKSSNSESETEHK